MTAECCDVMVAHSPPLFTARSAAAKPAAELVLYQNFRLVMTHQKNMSPMSVRRLNSRSSSNSPTRDDRQQQQGTPTKTRKPCLVIRTDSDGSIGSSSSGSSSDENEPSSPIRRKKKVVFADDRGLSLTQVRLMSEPSNQPPKLMTVSPYLNQQSAAAVSSGRSNGKQLEQQWQLRFPQPASSYLDFRKRLDENNVSLENVIVKSPDKRIVGTVKVRNLSYDKEVFVRSTRDRWATHQDTLCTYVQNNAMVNASAGGGGCGGVGPFSAAAGGPVQNPVTAIYDTFSFRLPLPVDATSMEFAVCYKSAQFEYWDSNDGNNYWLSLGPCGVPVGGGGGPGCLQQQSAAVGPVPLQQHAASAGSSMSLASSLASTSCMSTVDFDHHLQHAKQPVHYFGSESRQNSWNVWRDQKLDNDSSGYW